MSTQRFLETMMLDLSLDQKKIEDSLERIINSDQELDVKIKNFKHLLTKSVELDSAITKFNEIVNNFNTNNNDNKTENSKEND